ncbi:MAG TPA: hypothetical protein VGW38_08660 [Chloroflexota bacterium]|nr:hypothetical protein [Chloroflexota bacterium]
MTQGEQEHRRGPRAGSLTSRRRSPAQPAGYTAEQWARLRPAQQTRIVASTRPAAIQLLPPPTRVAPSSPGALPLLPPGWISGSARRRWERLTPEQQARIWAAVEREQADAPETVKDKAAA